MTLQILDVVLFSHHGQRRILPFRVGEVNVITGASKTGKSALVDIVDYCFCAGECRVPEGPIRRCVAWFGLRLQLGSGQAFIARRCPSPQAASTEDCFVEVAQDVELPAASELRQTTNSKGLATLLAGWTGIGDNLHDPPPRHSRPALTATIRHALPFCFQPQDEIIRRQQLFHGSADNFFAQAMKDTFPYFLGAVDTDYVRKREQLQRLREQLRAVDRQLAELQALRGEGVSKAATLLAQARDVGISAAEPSTWDSTVAALRDASTAVIPSAANSYPDSQEFASLSAEREQLLSDQARLHEKIAAARAFERDEQGFSREAKEQRARLASIGVFEGTPANHACPLCAQPLPDDCVPTDTQIKETLQDVSSRLQSVARATPQVEKAISELEVRLHVIHGALAQNRAQMEAVQESNQRLQEMHDQATRRAHVVGRISLYLESLPELPDTRSLEQQRESLQVQISALEDELSDERVKERVDSILSILASWMTHWARGLELEHSAYPLRLDIKKLTVVADTADGPVPMTRMGSGENWVGYHLIAHLALHRWFSERKRPVPRFLFLDQPSQVYFPSEKDVDGSMSSIEASDRLAVSRMFRLVFEVVGKLSPNLQVIMTEHADLSDDWFQKAVIEKWRGPLKLVPDDWPRSASSSTNVEE